MTYNLRSKTDFAGISVNNSSFWPEFILLFCLENVEYSSVGC